MSRSHAGRKGRVGGAQKAYKARLEPVEEALKALAKPFDEQISEERKRKLDPEAARGA